jgi:glyoxylase-like metal-dependent hydrolase (beta-lactamase superfamily II)
MKKLSLLFAVFILLACVNYAPAHHQQDPKDPFTLKKLTNSIYALYGRGGNVGFFVGPDAVTVVDSQFMDLAPGIVEQIKSVTDKPIKFLINTHHHGDHVGGNEHFIHFALILAHDNVRKRMLESPQDILKEYPKLLEEAKRDNKTDAIKFFEEQLEWAKKVKVEEIAAPVVTYNSELRIHPQGETIQVWHTVPAHTDGDSVVYFERGKVLHMGDVFFHKVIPFIDVEGGGSAKGYLTAIDSVIKRVPSDVTIIPGHGEVTDMAELKIFMQYIQDLIDLAKKAKAAGKTKEQFIQEADLPQYRDWKGYEDRFKENAEAAYGEL